MEPAENNNQTDQKGGEIRYIGGGHFFHGTHPTILEGNLLLIRLFRPTAGDFFFRKK